MKVMGYLARTLLISMFAATAMAQTSGDADTARTPFQKGGIYDRPYIAKFGGNTAVGGYMEMNSNYVQQQGVSEGFSFEMRRFNVFLYSAVSEWVKLTSELEFEHGTSEIKLETALADLLLATPLNFRAGVLLVPLGRFNVSHDSPRYNVIDRPLVSTEIIPATLSEVGAGLFGAFYPGAYDRLSYEIYAVNGLQDGIILGGEGGTRISAGKSEEFLAEDNNGSPALTSRLAYSPSFGGEFGVSVYSGIYNTYRLEGVDIDQQRRVTLYALDAEYSWRRLLLRGESALAIIDTPDDHVDRDFLARRQWGFYVEGNYTLLQRPLFGLPQAKLLAVCRYDDIDLNDSSFQKTGGSIGDDTRRITVGLSLRPTSDTSIRLSYWHQWQRDFANNLSKQANVQFGFATYF